MYRENYINSLRTELVSMVSDHLSPIAMRYFYSEVPLETTIKWRPQVLILGNYSSGKSTMINEFLGGDIQATGQAPTDDSFTIITYDDSVPDNTPVHVVEERDGNYLLNDPEYPFETMKKHGQRFASHFRLKKVNSPFLRNLAIIDTPGMHDSISEQDRGYNYQQVIADFAQIADLVLILFDPHKAGTVREAHTSLKDTLPNVTFEDRIIFVLNRIDECSSLIDLIRVYGTLCWNLSQMTGRKDIPTIRLTYSQRSTKASNNISENDIDYLKYLDNQREELKKSILEAPRYRLDNLATFVETHAQRLAHFLEALINYRKKYWIFRVKYFISGFLLSLTGGGAILLALLSSGALPGDPNLMTLAGSGISLAFMTGWMTFIKKYFYSKFHNNLLKNIDDLTEQETQIRRDSWKAIKELTFKYLKKTNGNYSLWQVEEEYDIVRDIITKGSQDIREALNELATIKHENVPITPKAALLNKKEEDEYFKYDSEFLKGIPLNYY